jgi:hypothetical protein
MDTGKDWEDREDKGGEIAAFMTRSHSVILKVPSHSRKYARVFRTGLPGRRENLTSSWEMKT